MYCIISTVYNVLLHLHNTYMIVQHTLYIVKLLICTKNHIMGSYHPPPPIKEYVHICNPSQGSPVFIKTGPFTDGGGGGENICTVICLR